MKNPRKLRWQLALSMTGTVLLLWAVLMGIFTYTTSLQVAADVDDVVENAVKQLDQAWGNADAHPALDEGEGMPGVRLDQWLSDWSMDLTRRGIEGGMTLSLRDEKGVEFTRSRLAWGSGAEEVGGKAWYLQFDQALDDAGQLALARWIDEHRGAFMGAYQLCPPEFVLVEAGCADGTVARVTGIEQGAYDLVVQRIELVRPDGGVELLIETFYQGENPVTVELKIMELNSALEPWGDSYGDFKTRLSKFRGAQDILWQNQEGAAQSVLTSGGGLSFSTYGGGGRGVVTWEYSNLASTLYRMRWVYPITLLVALLVLAFLSSNLSRRLSRPLEQLACAAEQGRPGCDHGPIVEVNSLAAAFNTAQQKLSDDLKREQDLTRAVAHELKTPLAILRAHAEALSENIAPEKQAQYLSIIMDESDRMSSLVGELLDLSRMEAGAEKLSREEVDLEALTRRVFSRIEALAHVSLTLAPLTVPGDPAPLERAISNYASNALRHCAPGGEIRVTLRAEGGVAHLTVENDGEAIPPEALPHLWDTFYKVDTARTRGNGTGLGLAIVRSVATLHGGSCAVENRKDGPAFRLSLPCNGPTTVV